MKKGLLILLIAFASCAEDYYQKTISSISVRIDNKEVFLNDTSFTEEKAIRMYNRNEKYLGKYNTINEAKTAAKIMQSELEKKYKAKGQLVINTVIY
jgi:hypothetical protein